MKLFVVYILDTWLRDLNTDLTLGNFLFRAPKPRNDEDPEIQIQWLWYWVWHTFKRLNVMIYYRLNFVKMFLFSWTLFHQAILIIQKRYSNL